MGKLPAVKPREVIKALQRAGFYLHHQTGSHVRLIHQTKPHRRVSIPLHNKDLKKGTFKSILRQAELSVEEFIKLL